MFHVKHLSGGVLEGVCAGSARGLGRSGGTLARSGAMLAALLLAACSSPEDIAANAGVSAPVAPPAAPPAAPAPPVPTPGKAEFTDNEEIAAEPGEASRRFGYSWPAEVSVIPALAATFAAERDRLLAEQKADFKGALADFAGESCGGCKMREFQKGWEVVADLPRFLSLSSSSYEYAGGAHGNHWPGALVWDREANKALDPKAMFRSEAALQEALGAPWCKALAAEKRKRLGEDYADDGFFPCPPVKDLAVLVGSADSKAFDRVGLIAAPYVAGSYAEGEYEVTLPVTPAVLAAVKPEYKAAFALAK